MFAELWLFFNQSSQSFHFMGSFTLGKKIPIPIAGNPNELKWDLSFCIPSHDGVLNSRGITWVTWGSAWADLLQRYETQALENQKCIYKSIQKPIPRLPNFGKCRLFFISLPCPELKTSTLPNPKTIHCHGIFHWKPEDPSRHPIDLRRR